MHTTGKNRRAAAGSLVALLGTLGLLLALPATSMAEESNPNAYECSGHIKRGAPEAGNEEPQVAYKFHCDGPITGYQIIPRVPVTGVGANAETKSLATGASLTDLFSCSGEFPGTAVNCVGATKAGEEEIEGEFSIEHNACKEKYLYPELTVVFATYEESTKTLSQAISGPYRLGKPQGCPKPKPKKHKKRSRHTRRDARHDTRRHTKRR